MLTDDDTHASRLLRLLPALSAHARRYGQSAHELLFMPATAGWWLALYTGTVLLAARVLAFSEVERAAVTVTTDHLALDLLAAPLDGVTLRVADVRRVCDAAVAAGPGCAAELADVEVDPAELLTALDGLDGETLAVVGRLMVRKAHSLSIADLAGRWRVFLSAHGPRDQVKQRAASQITAEVELPAEATRAILTAVFDQETVMLCPEALFDHAAFERVDRVRRALRDAQVRVIL